MDKYQIQGIHSWPFADNQLDGCESEEGGCANVDCREPGQTTADHERVHLCASCAFRREKNRISRMLFKAG